MTKRRQGGANPYAKRAQLQDKPSRMSVKAFTSSTHNFPLYQKDKILNQLSIITKTGISSPVKALLFCSFQINQKKARGIEEIILF